MLTQSTSPRRATRIVALSLAFLLLLAAVTTALVGAAAPGPAELGGSVNWHEPPQIVSSADRIAFPWGVVGANNVTNIVYYTAGGDVMFTSNASGAFNLAGTRLDSTSSQLGPDQIASIAVGPNNVLGIVYTTKGQDEQIYYRQSTDGGLHWSARRQVSSGQNATTPDLAFDSAGNVHMVWMDNRCDTHIYNIYYRVLFTNGLMGAASKPRDACGTFQKAPKITIAGGKPHVAFQYGAESGGEVLYRRLEGGQWVGQSISASNSIASQNATIASDGGNNLFVAWDENINDNTNHEIYFRASFDGGQTWTNAVDMSSGSAGISTNPHLTWSPSAKRAYLVWQDEFGGSSTRPEIWEREFDPAALPANPYTFADQISHTELRSLWPTVGAGPSQAAIVWQDEPSSTRPFQVYYLGGQVIGGPTGCDGSLLLNGGVATTRDRTLSGTITPKDNCVPDQMQVSLDIPVTDATPKIAYSASLPPQTVPEGGCVHTVYVRLFKGGGGGTVFSDSIKVDSSVDASVLASNPHLNGIPAFPDLTVPGASDGDPGYTRETKFLLRISGIDDCSGLTTFSIPTIGSGTIANGTYADTFGLPNTTPGEKQFIVTVNDTVGNTAPFPQSIIYDPTAPVLTTTANPTVTAPLSTTSIIVPLEFQNIKVTDNLYGDGTGPGTNDFWGVWVANSTTNVTPDNPGLKWLPVQVSEPGPSFTISWNLFSGLGPQQQQGDKDYYIYVRFLDGAGNPTTSAIRVEKIHLEANPDLPTLYLPGIHK